MNISEKKIRERLQSSDAAQCREGLKAALSRRVYSCLPLAVKLMQAGDPDTAAYARSVAFSLAESCLFERNTQPVLRATAVQIIEKMDPQRIRQNRAALEQGNPGAIIQAMIFLKHFIADNEAEEILQRFISHPDNKVRATVVLHIGTIVCKKGANILGKFLKDSDNRVKANAIEVIERLDNRTLVRVIARFRSDENNRIRANVLKALFTMNHEDISADLENMLRDERPLMRTSAVWVIGEIGGREKQYLELLKLVAHDGDELLRKNLYVVLKKVGIIPELDFLKHVMKEEIRQSLKSRIIQDASLRIELEKKEAYLLIRLKGAVTSTQLLSLKLKFEEENIIRHHEQIVLDFAEVPYIDSSGIGFLLNLAKNMKNRQGILFVCNCSLKVLEILQLSRADQVLSVFQTREEIEEFIF